MWYFAIIDDIHTTKSGDTKRIKAGLNMVIKTKKGKEKLSV